MIFNFNMLKAASAQTQMNVTYLVTLKKDGTLYLEDQPHRGEGPHQAGAAGEPHEQSLRDRRAYR